MRGDGDREGGDQMIRRWSVLVIAAVLFLAIAGLMTQTRRAPAAIATQAGGYSPTFRIAGAVARPLTLDLAALEARGAVNVVHRCYYTDTLQLEEGVYTGVPLWSLLTEAGLVEPPGPAPASLRGYVVVSGSDGYQVIVALATFDPRFEGQKVLVAYAANDAFLDESRGMARLIVADDTTCMRGVWWLSSIEVRYID